MMRILTRTLLLLSFLALTATARADDASNPLIGTWTLVSVDNVSPDGTHVHLYGNDPKGLLMFDAHGRYMLQLVSTDRPKFAAGDKSKGTPEEMRAAVIGSNAHFGQYTLDQARHTITFSIEYASYPNWEGTTQVRSFTLDGDTLTYSVPVPTIGKNVVGEVSWERAH
jgi:hypothetical protein